MLFSSSLLFLTSRQVCLEPLSGSDRLRKNNNCLPRTEAALATQPFAFVPARQVRQAEAALREGDIIMLTAARPGLDMKHVGLAVRQPDGRMHLLHASSDAGQVIISTLPLSDYVLAHPRLSGIRVARLRGSGLLTADGSPR